MPPKIPTPRSGQDALLETLRTVVSFSPLESQLALDRLRHRCGDHQLSEFLGARQVRLTALRACCPVDSESYRSATKRLGRLEREITPRERNAYRRLMFRRHLSDLVIGNLPEGVSTNHRWEVLVALAVTCDDLACGLILPGWITVESERRWLRNLVRPLLRPAWIGCTLSRAQGFASHLTNRSPDLCTGDLLAASLGHTGVLVCLLLLHAEFSTPPSVLENGPRTALARHLSNRAFRFQHSVRPAVVARVGVDALDQIERGMDRATSRTKAGQADTRPETLANLQSGIDLFSKHMVSDPDWADLPWKVILAKGPWHTGRASPPKDLIEPNGDADWVAAIRDTRKYFKEHPIEAQVAARWVHRLCSHDQALANHAMYRSALLKRRERAEDAITLLHIQATIDDAATRAPDWNPDQTPIQLFWQAVDKHLGSDEPIEPAPAKTKLLVVALFGTLDPESSLSSAFPPCLRTWDPAERVGRSRKARELRAGPRADVVRRARGALRGLQQRSEESKIVDLLENWSGLELLYHALKMLMSEYGLKLDTGSIQHLARAALHISTNTPSHIPAGACSALSAQAWITAALQLIPSLGMMIESGEVTEESVSAIKPMLTFIDAYVMPVTKWPRITVSAGRLGRGVHRSKPVSYECGQLRAAIGTSETTFGTMRLRANLPLATPGVRGKPYSLTQARALASHLMNSAIPNWRSGGDKLDAFLTKST